MDTLHDRLAELADQAPTGGAPAGELWARGRRAHRRRVAALAAIVLVVGVVGTGIGVRIAAGGSNRPEPLPAKTVGIALPVTYPVGAALPDLGDTPGPLAAVWLAPRAGGGALEFVGLVAETGAFGTLPIDLPDPPADPQDPDTGYVALELSPDGRRIAYNVHPASDLVVHDLVTGEEYGSSFGFGIRTLEGWVDDTHLFGRVAGGGDGDGWVWKPGTAPERVDFYTVPYGESGLSVAEHGGGAGSDCSSPVLQDVENRQQNGGGWAGAFRVPVLCDVLGVTDSGVVLGHWKNRQDGSATVVALDVHAADPSLGQLVPAAAGVAEFDDPALRRPVLSAGAPDRVVFATDLIAQALRTGGGAP